MIYMRKCSYWCASSLYKYSRIMEKIIINWYEITLTWKQDGNAKDPKFWAHAKYCSVKQCHSTKIIDVQWEEIVGPIKEDADGIFWTKEELYAWVYTADCWMVCLMWKKYFTIVHAWRRGLYQGILHEAVKKLCSHWEEVIDITVYFGPQICMNCFEFGPECTKYFPLNFIQETNWKFTVDLLWYGVSQLIFHGIQKENITTHTSCTYEDPNYYSARLGQKERNFMGVRYIWSN